MKPTLRRILRDEQTLQYGVHPLRAVMLNGLTKPVRQWIEGLDGTRDLEAVLRDAALSGLDEMRARALLDQLAAQGVLHDAAVGPGTLRDLPLAERDRLKPELDALDLGSTAPDGMIALFERRQGSRVRVYGAGRVGAQIVAMLAAAGVGNIRVLDDGTVQPSDLTPGGLTWSEVGLTREAGAVAVAMRVASGGVAYANGEELSGHGEAHGLSAARSANSSDSGGPADPTSRTPGTGTGSRPSPGTSAGSRPSNTAARPVPSARIAPPPNTRAALPNTRAGLPNTRATSPNTRAGTRHDAPLTPRRDIPPTTPRNTRAAASRSEPPAPTPQDVRTARSPQSRAIVGPGRTPASGVPNPSERGSGGNLSERAAGGNRSGRRTAGVQDDEFAPCSPTVNVLAGGTFLADKSDRPDLVILAPVTPMDGVLVNDLNELRIPHLLVSAFEGHGTVGPLVVPGDTACLHCLDLTRRDSDPLWPMVTARLGGYPPGEIACDVALATAMAAAATGHALAFLDGKESSVTNGTIEVSPDWRWKRRSWKAHPQCRCMRNNPYSLRMVMAPDRD